MLRWAEKSDGKITTYRQKLEQALKSAIGTKEVRDRWGKCDTSISWKLSIFEVPDSPSDVLIEHLGVNNVRELCQHFMTLSGKERSRQVIILENVDPEVAEVLGVELDIPPEFFLAHSDMFTKLSVVDRSYAKRGSSNYWKVPIPQRRSPNGLSNISREESIRAGLFERPLSAAEPVLEYYSFMSFWGGNHEGDSWTGR